MSLHNTHDDHHAMSPQTFTQLDSFDNADDTAAAAIDMQLAMGHSLDNQQVGSNMNSNNMSPSMLSNNTNSNMDPNVVIPMLQNMHMQQHSLQPMYTEDPSAWTNCQYYQLDQLLPDHGHHRKLHPHSPTLTLMLAIAVCFMV